MLPLSLVYISVSPYQEQATQLAVFYKLGHLHHNHYLYLFILLCSETVFVQVKLRVDCSQLPFTLAGLEVGHLLLRSECDF